MWAVLLWAVRLRQGQVVKCPWAGEECLAGPEVRARCPPLEGPWLVRRMNCNSLEAGVAECGLSPHDLSVVAGMRKWACLEWKGQHDHE